MRRVAMLVIFTAVLGAQPPCQGLAESGPAAKPPAPNADAMRRWQDMRFGMFIHWGPVSLKGTEIGWSRGKEVPKDEYDELYKKFNPTKFNADEWVAVAKAAGMKYLVITSKHHDGFCLWDSKLTDYDIMATPFQRDVLKELSAACKRQGISFSTYHSILRLAPPGLPDRQPRRQRPQDRRRHGPLRHVPERAASRDHRELRSLGHHVVRRRSGKSRGTTTGASICTTTSARSRTTS